MSRFRHAAMSLASGYAAQAVAVLYQLASVPLAMHYLSQNQFGLWLLVTNLASYLLLIDLGITGAVARTLIDHKDEKDRGEYGSVIKTAAVAQFVQGGFVALGGILLSFLPPGWIHVPAELVGIFRVLTIGQCLLFGLFFVERILMGILQAHQRFDVLNYSQILQLLVGFLVQWVTFHWGWGLYSFLAASTVCSVLVVAHNLVWILKLRLLPPRGAWGRVDGKTFREVFAFGRDLFLLALGNQFLYASQVLIITNTQGLAAATVWTVASKTFLLAFQFVSRIFDFSGTALGEMIVRHEEETLRRRFRDVLAVTASAAVFVTVSIVVCNRSFLTVWVEGKVAWPLRNDILMGLMILIRCVSRCYVGLSGYAKQIRTMRWIYFLEGVSFVIVAFAVSRPTGMTGIIVASILTSLVWSGAYGVHWSARYLAVTRSELAFQWLKPAICYLLLLAPPAALLWWVTLPLSALPRLVLNSLTLSAVGLTLFWRIGLTEELRKDLKGRFLRFRARRASLQ